LFTRISRLVDEGRKLDNLIAYFWPAIPDSDYEQVFRSLGTKAGSKIFEKHYLSIAKHKNDFKKKDIEWLRPSPGDSSTLSFVKQLLREPDSINIGEVVYLSMSERNKEIVEIFYTKKIAMRAQRIMSLAKSPISDGLSPVLHYMSSLQGYSKVHIKSTQLGLRHMLLWLQSITYSYNVDWPLYLCRDEEQAYSKSKNLTMFPPGMLFLEDRILVQSLYYLFKNIDQIIWPEWYRRAFSDLAEHLLLNFDYTGTQKR
jgi:hypothetical protein